MNNSTLPDNPPKKKYRAYLLRLWRAESYECWSWRASLEDPHTGERIGFESLERLFAFLMEQIEREANLKQ